MSEILTITGQIKVEDFVYDRPREELEHALRHEYECLKRDMDDEQFEPWLEKQLERCKA